MDLRPPREDLSCEEHEQMMRGKLPFSYYSSSPSCEAASDVNKLHDLMDMSPRNEDDDLRRGGDSQDDGLGSGSTITGRGQNIIMEKEHMFDKVVTPSDVGKLNRLVIPKQHAEKYFPLDSTTNEKGLLLNFEDRNGKPWRFRYSYWNSSQSYVMTKGWSRFVKEKKLDAGDIVSFQRGVGEQGRERLYIDWRRRPEASDPMASIPNLPRHYFSFHRPIPSAWSTSPPNLLMRPRDHLHLSSQQMMNANNSNNVNLHHPYRHSYGNSTYCNYMVNPPLIYTRSATAALSPQQQHHHHHDDQPNQLGLVRNSSAVEPPMVFESVPVVQGKVAAKRLRLFGVNMDCPISESDACDVILSSTTIGGPQFSSASQSAIPFRPYNGTPLPTVPTDLLDKGKASKSLDFDI